jgi:hypothetical protein
MYQVDVKECTYNHLRNYLGSINDKLARWNKKERKKAITISLFYLGEMACTE